MFVTDPARASILLLTGLMVIGLGFFIRASTKDRIEVARFGSLQKADALKQAVLKYFQARAYRPIAEDSTADTSTVDMTTLVGLVSPSIFMAVFLSALAAVGLVCLALMMATLLPLWGGFFLGLVAVSPLAGVFYWRKSYRTETVIVKIESAAGSPSGDQSGETEQNDHQSEMFLSRLVIKGHRDEIADLQKTFAQPDLKAWAGLSKLD